MIKKLNTEGMEKIAGGDLEVKYVGPSGSQVLDENGRFFAIVDTETGNWVDCSGTQWPAGTDWVRVPIEKAKLALETAKQHIAEGYNGPFIAFPCYESLGDEVPDFATTDFSGCEHHSVLLIPLM